MTSGDSVPSSDVALLVMFWPEEFVNEDDNESPIGSEDAKSERRADALFHDSSAITGSATYPSGSSKYVSLYAKEVVSAVALFVLLRISRSSAPRNT